jgi:hypothetical protein
MRNELERIWEQAFVACVNNNNNFNQKVHIPICYTGLLRMLQSANQQARTGLLSVQREHEYVIIDHEVGVIYCSGIYVQNFFTYFIAS